MSGYFFVFLSKFNSLDSSPKKLQIIFSYGGSEKLEIFSVITLPNTLIYYYFYTSLQPLISECFVLP